MDNETRKTVFEILNGLADKGCVDKKNGLDYISWAVAWKRVKKAFPSASFNVERNADNLPYFASPLGIIVYTTVTIEGETLPMWLPVMNARNQALKTEPYQAYGRDVPAATMCDVNKTIQRCLTKNLAVFGFGIEMWTGDDLPKDAAEEDRAASGAAQVGAAKAVTAKPEKTPAQTAWVMFNALDSVKKMDKDTRTAEWYKLLKDNCGTEDKAKVKPEGWQKLINALDIEAAL